MQIKIIDYPDKQIVEIEGVNYHYSLFYKFGIHGMKAGQLFKLISRKSRVLEIEEVKDAQTDK